MISAIITFIIAIQILIIGYWIKTKFKDSNTTEIFENEINKTKEVTINWIGKNMVNTAIAGIILTILQIILSPWAIIFFFLYIVIIAAIFVKIFLRINKKDTL